MRSGIDAEPGKAERPAGQPLRGGIERTMHQRHHIGAGPPIRLDRQVDIVVADLGVEGPDVIDAVAHDRDRRGAGEFRVEMQLRRVARAVIMLVERHLERLGRVGGGAAAPAGIEAHRGLGRAVGRAQIEPVAAIFHGRLERGRCAGGEVDMSVAHLAGRGDRLILPAAVAPEPLVVLVHLARASNRRP